MIRLMRERSKFLLWILVIIVVVSFSLWGTYSFRDGYSHGADSKIGRIGGREISLQEYQKVMQRMYYYLLLTSGHDIPISEQLNQHLQTMAWQQLLLIEKANQLGIDVSDQQIADSIRRMPIFWDEKTGTYQPEKYMEFVQKRLPAMGLNEVQFHEMVRDHVLNERMTALIVSSARVAPAEVKHYAEKLYGKTELVSVEFDRSDYIAGIVPREEELKKAYSENLQMYSTPEERKVKYVQFRLPDIASKLPKEKKQEALNKLGEVAVNFTVALLGDEEKKAPSFEALAKENGYEIKETEFFTYQSPPKDFAEDSEFVVTAFGLNNEQPDSEVVQVDDSFYVLHLSGLRPSQPQSFEKVRGKVVNDWIKQRSLEATLKATNEMRQKMANLMQTGKSFDQAVTELKLKTRMIPAFVPLEEEKEEKEKKNKTKEDRELERFKNVAVQLEPGEVSAPQRKEDGAFFVYLVSRQEPKVDAEKQEEIKQQLLDQKRQLQFQEWVVTAMRQKGNEIYSQSQSG
ncbi:MAG: peptidylprolyl isomerase [Verrucomicrobiia bacterium]